MRNKYMMYAACAFTKEIVCTNAIYTIFMVLNQTHAKAGGSPLSFAIIFQHFWKNGEKINF